MKNVYHNSFSIRRLFYGAKRMVVICCLCMGVQYVSAQVYSTVDGSSYRSSYGERLDYSSQQVQSGYNAYQSTVHQPFASSPNLISGRRNTGSAPSTGGGDPTNPDIPDPNNPGDGELPDNWFDPDHPSDPGHQSNQSPVGEAWVMLLFAAVAAAVVFVRQRKAAVKG